MHYSLVLLSLLLLAGCTRSDGSEPSVRTAPIPARPAANRVDSIPIASDELRTLVWSAIGQTEYTVEYDPAYVALEYPGGDVPRETGVCADVVVRAFRAVGIDLQKEVHEDMADNFSSYPKRWGLRRPDKNIDHRRVANLMTYFTRRGASLPPSSNAADYQPGDVVAWELDNGLLHIGLVTNHIGESGEPMVVHNIGAGARVEQRLFEWKILGRYRVLR